MSPVSRKGDASNDQSYHFAGKKLVKLLLLLSLGLSSHTRPRGNSTMHICMASGFTVTVSRLLHFSILASAGGPQGFKLELFRPT